MNSTTTTRSRQGTPTKAILSSLNSRSAPSVPPSEQLYSPLAKAVLRRRLLNIVFPFSALFAWLISASWISWQRGGVDAAGIPSWFTNLFHPITLLVGIIWWTIGCVPTIVLRRSFITVSPLKALSPKDTFIVQSGLPNVRAAFLVFAISSTSLAIIYSISTYATGSHGNHHLWLFNDSLENPFQINGCLLYIFLSQVMTSLAFSLRDILQDRFAVKLSMEAQANISIWSILPQLIPSVIATILLATLTTFVTVAAFTANRAVVLPLICKIPILSTAIRPFCSHFLTSKPTLFFLWTHFDVIMEAYALNLTTLLVWDIPSVLFTYCSSIPVRATIGMSDSTLRIVSGVNAADDFIQLHAFYELFLLASDSSLTEAKSKRLALFEDSRHNPSMWACLLRQCLVLLGRDYQLFLRRGKPAVAERPPALPVPVAVTAQEIVPSTPIKLIRQDIYKTTPKKTPSSPLIALGDSFSADGAITKAVKTTANVITTKAMDKFPDARKALAASIASFGRTAVYNESEADRKTTSVKDTKDQQMIAVVGPIASAIQTIKRVRSGDVWKVTAVAEWWSRDRVHKVAVASLPNKTLDILIVRVLSNLIVHSLFEDTLGIVQRDIPRVLESFLTLLSALEAYHAEFAASGQALVISKEQEINLSEWDRRRREQQKEEIALAQAWIRELIESLQTGVGLMVQSFGDRLTAFKLPPSVARKLQVFVDYL